MNRDRYLVNYDKYKFKHDELYDELKYEHDYHYELQMREIYKNRKKNELKKYRIKNEKTK
jgi:hypothetical protein